MALKPIILKGVQKRVLILQVTDPIERPCQNSTDRQMTKKPTFKKQKRSNPTHQANAFAPHLFFTNRTPIILKRYNN